MESHRESDSGDFSIYQQSGSGNGRHYTKLTVTLSAVCLIVGGLVRGVWDVAEYSHQQTEFRARITTLETASKVQGAALDTAQRTVEQSLDRTLDMRARIGSLETSLNQANATLQKLSESNARLEERVIFLVAQMEGRLAATRPGDGGVK